MTTRIHGLEAIDYADAHGLNLSKHADPIEDAREGLSVDEARDIAEEDSSLIYVDMPGASELDLYEINDGTLYLVSEAEGIAVEMPSGGDFLTDAHLYRASWFPEDFPNSLHALVDVRALLDDQQTKHTATYRIVAEELRIHLEPEEMGHAAREYMRASFEEVA